MCVEERVEPPQTLLARAQELVIQQRDGRRKDRACRARAADEVVAALPRDDDVRGLRCDVGEAAAAAVELAGILAADTTEVRSNDVLLEIRRRVEV